jgi:GDP-L-fucose synthase
MKILVTGSSGFLGSFLCKELVARGHDVTCVHSKNCDLRLAGTLSLFNESRFDRIYHLAAWTQAGDFCLYHPGEQWVINQKINTNVLDWWHREQPQAKLICMGTSCSYDPALPLSEEHYLQGQPIDSLFTYAMTKRMLLTGLKALHQQYGLQYLYLIPSTLYGPSYHTDGRQMHFIFDLIRKILRGKWFGEPVELWGDGLQKRELIHVRDFVAALLALTEKENSTHINIGSGKEHSIKEFAQLICKTVDFPFEDIAFDTSKYVGARSKVLVVEKMHSCLPNFPWTSLQEGLNETIAWFVDQRELLLREKGR